ncbi:hypothetical protein [Thiocapsa sp.]|uniref:hypothetical protein n=1 Tax=Thiocapsa sp. TaxID=2024551 RepID=UPI0025F7B800|nr:hypothetical protein [Thiocapsa sp.]
MKEELLVTTGATLNTSAPDRWQQEGNTRSETRADARYGSHAACERCDGDQLLEQTRRFLLRLLGGDARRDCGLRSGGALRPILIAILLAVWREWIAEPTPGD